MTDKAISPPRVLALAALCISECVVRFGARIIRAGLTYEDIAKARSIEIKDAHEPNASQCQESNWIAELCRNSICQHCDGTLLVCVEISPRNPAHRVPRSLIPRTMIGLDKLKIY